MLQTYLSVAIYTIFIENYVLVQFLGICPFMGVSKKTETAVGMSMAVIFTMTLSSAATWAANKFILIPYELEYLQTITFILIIATLVQFIELFLKKSMPALYKALGIYLPLITTNCAVLGSAILGIQRQYDFLLATFYGFTAGLSFMFAIVLFSGIRERIELCNIPKPFRGFPIALIAASLLSIAFTGFSGLKIF
jgi:electron transport complex protein RnfA